ncbi:cell division protein ZapA [Ligilactobacillus agilis]|uniref:cell division protein ZapA n=1 Tax=Ligilactobacillus agilis TaxID=1601 RepID=UPI00067F5CA9|nr:cell division protein ZapA [Ligilactobacillus agilis]UNL42482.1 cell division protein ZapA [Ligilactobacillus agilis]UNL58115.1 cell division protein ZapA [Ligilactobacillus agilis]
MSEQVRRFKVEIDGQTYTVIGKHSPEHMKAVVDTVEEQLNQIKEMMPSLSKEKAAILIALNAVSDQLEKQAQLNQLSDKLPK